MGKLNAREPRSRLIGRYVENWLNGTIEKQSTYADSVREIYYSHYPDPADRRVKFRMTGDVCCDLRENRQIVMRRLRGEIKFESDIEEAAIEALPERQRMELYRLLLSRSGLLAAKIPTVTQRGTAHDIGRFAREFADAIEAVGDLLVDGVIDSNDAPDQLLRAEHELDDLIGAALTFKAAIEAARDAQP
ncbi:MAG: hypothetical protein KZQ99_02405 [Candidatus Thiodiazotropha sp. (ex Dulcina madagascariensis)]|nr:hypothetical protein [Candidatus Thiodiazotropha sp. (ex Dulcina madagascariensis)]